MFPFSIHLTPSIGYEEGGQLTEKLRKNPRAVVLLDEVEKAHAEVLTIMLQVFDEGRVSICGLCTHWFRDLLLVDGRQRQDDRLPQRHLHHDVQLGPARDWGHFLQNQTRIGGWEAQARYYYDCITYYFRPPLDFAYCADEIAYVRAETNQFVNNVVQPILKRHFQRDEFLGRINEIIVFHPFSGEGIICFAPHEADASDLEHIVIKELDKWRTRSLRRQNITLKWTDALVHSLTNDYNVWFFLVS
jgi:ATP-dependent Clp protease ATP-binding subunit ClpB